MRREPYEQRLYVEAFGGDGDTDNSPQRDYGPYFPASKEWTMFKFDFILEERSIGSGGKRWHVIPRDPAKASHPANEYEVSMWLKLIDLQGRVDKLRDIIGTAQVEAARVR